MFEKSRGQPYLITWGRDGKLVQKLLQGLVGDNGATALQRLKAAAKAMLADRWARDKADVPLLSSQINRWVTAAAKGAGDNDQYAAGF